MLSIHFLRLLAEDRERELQRELRIRRLLGADDRWEATQAEGQTARYRASWRVRTPRASATTR